MNDYSPFLTVIIPVYNGIKYLPELIDSILFQDVPENFLEVLIADDGSTDGTAEYCDALQEQYPNIRVLHQENSGGPANPRNNGIRNSRSEYLFFADADDLFESDSLASMIQHAQEDLFDVALFKVDASEWNITYGGLFDRSQANCDVFNSKILNSLGPYKMFRRSIIEENQIFFPETCAYEDLPFTLECYLNSNCINIYSDKTYYVYKKREEIISLSRASSSDNKLFGTFENKIKGLQNYISTALSYCNPEDCPQVFERAVRYGLRAYNKAKNKESTLGYSKVVRDAVRSIYCDSVRSQLSLSLLLAADAMVFEDKSTDLKDDFALRLTINSKPSGEVYYSLGDSNSTTLVSAFLPLNTKWNASRILSSRMLSNCLSEARLDDSNIIFSGEIACFLDASCITESSLVARSSKGLEVFSGAILGNHECFHVSESLYFHRFRWRGGLSFSDFESFSVNSMIHFYFRFENGLSQFTESRFGHIREKGVFPSFIHTATRHGDKVYCPTETKHKNVSLNVKSIDDISSSLFLASLETKIVDSSKRVYLVIKGCQGFDNYVGTISECVLVSESGSSVRLKLSPVGTRRRDRGLSGSFDLSELKKGLYSITVVSSINGGFVPYRISIDSSKVRSGFLRSYSLANSSDSSLELKIGVF